MRDPHPERREGGGIPDGLLVALLVFLLGLTLLVWTATGLSALLAKGAWPSQVTFARTPLAIRHLISQPHDIPGAWPDSPEQAFSGYGLFWGLFIGQLMVLTVLVVFVMGTVARWRAVRKGQRSQTAPAVPADPAVGRRSAGRWGSPRSSEAESGGGWAQPHVPGTSEEGLSPVDTPAPEVRSAATEPTAPSTTTVPTPRTPLLFAPADNRKPPAVQAIQESEGPALIVTSNPALWEETKDARAKLGPVLLYDPEHRCDTPARMHWSPTTGCEDKPTAAARARALLAPVRPTARLDATTASTAETLLRSYLHAAAVDGRPFKHVHRWSQGSQVQEAVRVLRTSSKAASGSGGELEAALTAHPERRDMAQELTARALSALFSVHIREACAPNRTDTLTLDSFIAEGGTLYVVGEPIEDPKSVPGAMPLLTALVSSVVEHGRRMAARSSSGRLDPPLALILDDVAAVAPLPELPELLADGADSGLPTLALLRSREQARARWPHDDLPV
ncbi:type IV secretory system conjugative DNA transfer family protein [Streptomyces sp. LHD-70]|uniref:type IV secretory system conjugative DNA transfer family protein n=1 Tax=Streptomyces sp. LHD-70 TaxID=3072140 RepID=UPI00280EF2BF|nr:type IV secretory system conjugative DNA transfer family protein [Streptomyces sp. LHD-70]MDQ8704864.1 type IV secretory system conjugative DNA transfer family protein [Streptomyces sp. LHD-70]